MRKKKLRWWIAVVGTVALAVAMAFVTRPAYLLLRAWLRDQPSVEALPPSQVDDASRMNRTEVARVWSIPADRNAAESQLRELLTLARSKRLRIAIAGARHSMGGHTIYPDGIVINMLPFNHMELSVATETLNVGAGAKWSEVLPYLDSHGYSVGVMQSNNDFSVGGSLSVNCHGWQHSQPPIASTVRSLRVMRADGLIVRCNRSENAELFSLVLGGDGLFGIILDAELRVVPNERYRAEIEVVTYDNYVSRFMKTSDDAGLVYGRLCVVPDKEVFLREAILTVFRPAPSKREDVPLLRDVGYESLRRQIYRAQIGSESGKELRWRAEKGSSKVLASRFFSRNQLLNEEAAVYQEQNSDRTDILHEYFIPSSQFVDFLDRARKIIFGHRADLLNVTIRNVREDKDTFLRYADKDMFSFVMLFNQPREEEADRRMEEMTRELIDAALDCGGRYYLPYRLHATNDQFERAYQQSQDWFERKQHYDPDGIFQNQFYLKYAKR